MATSPSNLSPEETGSVNSASGIRYSLKIMEEPIRSFEFQTGIDLASIVNSEIFDKVPPSNIPIPPPPPSPRPKVRAPKRSSSFLTFQRRSLPPSYLQEALHSLFQKSSPEYNSYTSSKKKFSRPQKYPQHDLPLSFLNKRLVSRFPLNLYEKFRHKSHATMNSINESSSAHTELASSSSPSSSSSSSCSSSLTSSISLTETEIPEIDVEVVGSNGLLTAEEKESSSDGSESFAKKSTACKVVGASNSELDQFYNESKRKYDCAFCKSIFKYKGTLKRHLLVKHTSGDGVIDFSKGGKSKRSFKQFLSRKRT